MPRVIALVSVVVLAGVGSPAALGQTAAEVQRLKDRVELLEAKLKLAEREVQDLKAENEKLRAGGGKGAADDGFGVGTKLVGTLQRSWSANGKPMVAGDDVEFEVTKRSGKEFTAEFWSDHRKTGAEVEGTIENGVVKFSSTKSLTDSKEKVNLVGVHVFTGRFEKGVLTGRTTKKGDTTYRGEWKLKTKKD